MKELIVTSDYLPVPLPNDDVQKVRDWLARVIPLDACQVFIDTITDVRYDCGTDAPKWIRQLAQEIACRRPRPIDVQVTCYSAMIQQPIHKAFERIFEMSFGTPDDVMLDAPAKFQKYFGLFYRWHLERAAPEQEEFRQDPVSGRAAVSRVWFEVITDPSLFAQHETDDQTTPK